MSGLHSQWGVELFPEGAGSATIVGAITEQNIDTGTEVNAPIGAGAQSPQYGEVTTVQPGGSFTTADILKLAALLGNRGACLEGGAGPGFGLYHLKRKACGELLSGSVHAKTILPNGRCVPRSISAQHGSRATMSAEVMTYWDGTNDPLIKSSSVAAPTGLTDLVGFHLGEVNFAGVRLDRKTSVEINYGVTVETEADDGDLTAKSLQVVSFHPIVTVTCRDVEKFPSIALVGQHGTHSDTNILFRQKVNGSGAFMTGPNHMLATVDGIVTVRSIGASANSPTAMEIVLTSLDDQTNDMIVWDYAYEIPVV